MLIQAKCRFVKTDMGNEGAKHFGMAEAIESVDNATTFLAKTVSASHHPSLFSAAV